MNDPKRIYVVDDDQQVRTSLTFLLGSAGYSARPSGSGTAFLGDVGGLRSGCVLLDMRMPDMDGMQVIEALGNRIRDFPVVVMTGHGDIVTAVRAMKLGACDFLEKPFADNLLFETLARAFERLDAGIGVRDETATAQAQLAKLTPREHDVLCGLASGCSNKIIAYQLGLSTRTVEMHRASMMDHLQVRSLPEAMRLAFLAGVAPRSGAFAATTSLRE